MALRFSDFLLLSRNFIYSKKFFWFGDEAVDTKALTNYLKNEKVSDTAHHVAAWASQTGKGLLFYAEKGTDKTAPSGAILLVRFWGKRLQT